MNLQNLELTSFNFFIFTTGGLEVFLTLASMFLLVWILLYQNREDLVFPFLFSVVRWSTLLILILAAYILVYTNISNFNCISFGGFLFFDPLTFMGRMITILISLFFFLLVSFSSDDFSEGSNEFCFLVLISVLSLTLLCAVNDFLSFFLCIELQSLGFYVLSCLRRNSDYSIEAGVKYFITGAIASCFMLFGISLIYGLAGTFHFAELKLILSGLGIESNTPEFVGISLGLLFILVSLLFKIGSAPFHFWLPDVYEGSPTKVTAFFALVPKISLVVILIRLLFDIFEPLYFVWQPFLLICALTSVVIGTFGALVQRRIKRLLAYSTIGHNGFLVLAMASAKTSGVEALLIYTIFYMVTIFAIFLFVTHVRQRGSLTENPTFYETCSILKTNSLIGLSLVLPMFSLAGIPPLAGFVAKYQVFLASIQGGFILLPSILVATSVIACFYYIRLTKINFFDETLLIWNDQINRETGVLFGFCIILLFLLTLTPRFATFYI